MPSFFGIKFGEKKKKSDKTAQGKQPEGRKRIDQNALGEGQFFGKNLHQTTVVNGSIRSVSRANTAMSMRAPNFRSPYAHDTHNLAASSMFDLSTVTHTRNGSLASVNNLRPAASDANLRTRFGANNGSNLSLAIPTPGFGSRPSSRPGTPNGKAKPWVNPLDVHFARSSPSVPPAQRSPLVQIDTAADEKEKENENENENENETKSVFGEDADEMVSAMMATVKKKEELDKEAQEKEKELEKQKETARLEKERLDRQKATETKPAQGAEPPRQHQRPQGPPGPPGTYPQDQQRPRQQTQQPRPHQHPQQHRDQQRQQQGQQYPHRDQHRPQQGQQYSHHNQHPHQQQRPMDGMGGPGPVFRGNVDQRPGSRGGMRPNGPPGPGPNGPPRGFPQQGPHQGPPRHAPPTQGLPHPPHHAGPRQNHPGGPPSNHGGRGPRPHLNISGLNGPGPRPHGPGSPHGGRPYSPSPQSPSYRGPIPNEYRSQSPAPNGPGGNRGPIPNEHRSQSPGPGRPGNNRGPFSNESRSQSPAPGGNKPRAQGPNGYGPNSPPYHGNGPRPSGSGAPELDPLKNESPRISSPPSDDEPIEQFARPPIIQDVAAKRDTIAMNSPRRQSLSMRIEELEKTLLRAQAEAHAEDRRISSGSSLYSASAASIVSSLSENEEPIMATTIQPAPLRTATTSPPATADSRWQPPEAQPQRNGSRGPLVRGPLPRRPTLDEYGVAPGAAASRTTPSTRPQPQRQASGNGGNPRPSEESGVLNMAPSAGERSNTPQFRLPNWTAPGEESPVAPAPTQRPAKPIIPNLTGFQFDFEKNNAGAPPTPDSTTWPLPAASSSSPSDMAKEPATPSLLNRANAPPALNFNFSADAYSREQGPWTPPLRSLSKKMFSENHDDGRPSTAGGFASSSPSLAPALSVKGSSSQPRTPMDIGEEAGVAIGVARGLSVRDTGRANVGQRPVDAFGTGFI
ncbi:hypothetical protein B0H66DRAFT_71652 [Apodospora peruviana]|uniref:Uncharacterized protein n=1 Tax=Apodospora peruviana TaxID=516989 RepID=A0AAE0ITH8_9PEZI|nr:hypothetical protein B0H66DRAFT_71652 [Apodospora peruviana]